MTGMPILVRHGLQTSTISTGNLDLSDSTSIHQDKAHYQRTMATYEKKKKTFDNLGKRKKERKLHQNYIIRHEIFINPLFFVITLQHGLHPL